MSTLRTSRPPYAGGNLSLRGAMSMKKSRLDDKPAFLQK
ncbi:hypothetical protein QY96_01722 [Bacillus thermotolerans]|nr:hypothetical protein QY96_01722 [Bacillus thermotolerans]